MKRSAVCFTKEVWKDRERKVNNMTFEEMAGARYSVKKYSEKPVEEEKLQKILQVAGIAPTAKNEQCIRIYVLRTQKALAKAKELTPCTYGAPIVLLFAYEESEAYKYPEEEDRNSGAEDCSIVATHVMFEALEQGLGTCWVNRFTPAKAKEVFGLPQTEQVVLLMDVGYAAEGNEPLPNHEKKKPLGEIVKEL